MKDRHAYLIVAHNEFEILKVLLSMLDDERNDIYLHIDKKVHNIDLTEFQTQKSGLYILDKRINVIWGDISLIKVELLLFETAYKNGQYSYFHLLSGVDLPIQSQDYIHHFFDSNNGFEFVGFNHSNLCKRRVMKYFILTSYYKYNNKYIVRITDIIREAFLSFQDKFNYQRKEDIIFMKGSEWLSITPSLVSILLEKKDFILKRFKYTSCGDEHFVQSILWNSVLKKVIYCFDDEYIGCMRLIDWERGWPYIWRSSDYEELKNSEKLFARKFGSEDMNIVCKIQKEYSSNK